MRRRLTGWPAHLAPHLLFLIPELLMAAGPLVVAMSTDASGKRRFKMPDFFYGGQALIEGVMMRGRTTVAMSVRPPSGEIVTMSEPLPAALSADRKLIKIPFLRGMFLLYETLVIGTRMLMRSASLAAEGEDVELGKGMIAMTMVISIGFAIGLFFLLPLFLSTFAEDATNNDFAANAVEGLIRLVIFIAYIGLIGLMNDIRRVFAYHGAEHKAISAYEADKPLTPEEVDAFGTAHTRCGTTFLLIVVVISIFFFSLIPRAGVPLPLLFLSRIVLVPFIAAFAYELVRFGARHYGNRGRARALHAGAVAPVADDPAAGPIDARGQHRVARVVPGLRSRGGRRGEGMIDRLAELEARYEEISRQLSTPEVASDPSQLADLGREMARLEPIVAGLRSWRGVQTQLEQARGMGDDPDEEMRAMAREEVDRLAAESERLESELRLQLVPRDPNDDRDVIVEVRAGTGGEEASLFAADLYRMYARYADRRKWKVEIMSTSESEAGGYKEIIAEVRGDGAYSRLKFESGVHRVQRVPTTEAQGRIHTSTATVSVLPEADEVEVQIDEKDLRVDVYRSSGPGGQSVNTTDCGRARSRTCRPASSSRSRTRRASTRTGPRL